MQIKKKYVIIQYLHNYRFFNNIASKTDGVIILPARARNMYLLCEENIKSISFSDLRTVKQNEYIVDKFYRYVKYDEKYYFLPCKYCSCVYMEKNQIVGIGKQFRIVGNLRKTLTKAILDDAIDIGVLIGEETDYGVNLFVKKIVELKTDVLHNAKLKIGEIIYQKQK